MPIADEQILEEDATIQVVIEDVIPEILPKLPEVPEGLHEEAFEAPADAPKFKRINSYLLMPPKFMLIQSKFKRKLR